MNSIYEHLNKINDNESLSEKYNVNNVKELKKLQESSTGKNVYQEAQSIYDDLKTKGYSHSEMRTIFSIIAARIDNNFEPARPKLKATFPNLDI